MFTDIVGSTEKTARLGDRIGAELVRAHDAVVGRCLAQFSGRKVKHMGDGIMASFTESTKALDCAKDIQRSFAEYNQVASEPLHVTIGIDAGEPVQDGDDLFGATVQLASRLCELAKSGEIIVSETVRTTSSHPGILKERSAIPLKGFAKSVPIFECPW